MSTITEEDTEQLKLLNAAVKDAIAARTAWLDEQMPKYAKYKIGEDLFDLETGRWLGEVSSYYRYWETQNPMYDTSLSIEYNLRTQENVYDNTSRHAWAIHFGNRAELERHRR